MHRDLSPANIMLSQEDKLTSLARSFVTLMLICSLRTDSCEELSAELSAFELELDEADSEAADSEVAASEGGPLVFP